MTWRVDWSFAWFLFCAADGIMILQKLQRCNFSSSLMCCAELCLWCFIFCALFLAGMTIAFWTSLFTSLSFFKYQAVSSKERMWWEQHLILLAMDVGTFMVLAQHTNWRSHSISQFAMTSRETVLERKHCWRDFIRKVWRVNQIPAKSPRFEWSY